MKPEIRIESNQAPMDWYLRQSTEAAESLAEDLEYSEFLLPEERSR